MTLPSQASIVSIKTYIRPNDDVYAVYTFADGRQYVGEYVDGLKHGQGTATYANGDQEEGIWEEDEFLY